MSKRRQVYLLVGLALLSTTVAAVLWFLSIIGMPDHVADARIPITRVDATPGLPGINTDIEKRIMDGRYPGAVVVVAKGMEVLHSAALGVSDIETGTQMTMNSIFRAMSMTKPVTVVAAMQLVEQGKLELDAPVAQYLPELSTHSHSEGTALTLRHLISHTGGQRFTFLLPEGVTTLDERMRELAQERLSNPPGTVWRYNGVDAFDIVARVVEVVSAQPYAQYLEQHIFKPLGMNDTGYVVPPRHRDRLVAVHKAKKGMVQKSTPRDFNYSSGGAGLYTTAPDYSSFAQMLANGGVLGNVRVLGKKGVDQIGSEQLSVDFPGLTGEFAWAMGMRRVSRQSQQYSPLPAGSFGWSGAYGTHFWVNPESGFSAVFMINLTNAGGAGSPDAFDFERLVTDACNTDPRCSSESLERSLSAVK